MSFRQKVLTAAVLGSFAIGAQAMVVPTPKKQPAPQVESIATAKILIMAMPELTEQETSQCTDDPSQLVPTRELVGSQIMDFESSCARYTPKQLSEFKRAYSYFLTTAVNTLRDGGCKEPESMDELLKLCKAVLPILWSNFDFKETLLLIGGFSRKKNGKLGTLDCDTSSFVVADILNQFNVNSKLVSLKGHVILHAETAGDSVYIETNSKNLQYYSPDEFNKKYPITYNECVFQVENCIAYSNRSHCKLKLGDPAGALKDLSKKIELYPNSADAYFDRGYIRNKWGDPNGAIKDYTKAIELIPQFADAYNNRGFSRAALGLHKGAIEDYTKAIELTPKVIGPNPKLADIYYDRALEKSALGDDDGAVKDFGKAIGLDPTFVDAYYDRAIARRKLEDFEGARRDFKMARKLWKMIAAMQDGSTR